MKKSFLMLSILLLSAYGGYAQVTTYSNGHVGINRTQNYAYSRLAVGSSSDLPSGSYNTDIYSSNLAPAANLYNIGLSSEMYFYNQAVGTGRTIGVRGLAGNATEGYNYGVLGALQGSHNGTGILGVDATWNTTYILGKYISGKYAGYFIGDTRVEGVLTANTINTPSDIRLKENITPLSVSADGFSALDKVRSMNVFSYNYIASSELPLAERDTAGVQQDLTGNKSRKQLHYGLSAQELLGIYPDLVTEGQDGYLAVNYVELVPILIQSIQDLKNELDELRGERSAREGSSALFHSTSDLNGGKTSIAFRLADDVTTACIRIFDMQGKLVKQIPVASWQERVSFSSHELAAGVYLYSLVANGREVASKRMSISY